jgi:hypothetical protein
MTSHVERGSPENLGAILENVKQDFSKHKRPADIHQRTFDRKWFSTQAGSHHSTGFTWIPCTIIEK